MSTDPNLARHLIDRLGYGPRPGDLELIQRDGADRWIDRQLTPDSLPLPQSLTAQLASFTTLKKTAPELFVEYGPPSYRVPGEKPTPEQQKEAAQRARIIGSEAAEARIARALQSPRQLEERLVEFWFNHFNVFAGKGLDRLWVGAYEEQAIRPHVLGKFRDLVNATARHPAMLFYLDNWQNTAPDSPGARGNFKGLNENYARELMELHTLGVNGGYSQDDVIALARILTGWGFGGDGAGDNGNGMPRRPGMIGRMMMDRPQMRQAMVRNSRAFRYNPERHDTGDKMFLGRVIKGRGGDDGQREGEEAIDMLVRAPATAQHVSFQLAQFFVADAPDQALVTAMAKTFHDTDGDIRAVMRTLVKHPSFRDPATFATRFKTPYQFVLSAVRATDLPVRNIKPLYGTLALLGQPLFGCQTPDGFKCTEAAWLNADAMTRRISFAVALGSGRMPLSADPDPQGVNIRRPDRNERAARQGMGEGPRQDLTPPDSDNAAQQTNVAPVPADRLIAAMGGRFTANTLAVVADAAPTLKSGLLLGSPEFMRC
jgi:uncharacterized protein (DUF1800 family)